MKRFGIQIMIGCIAFAFGVAAVSKAEILTGFISDDRNEVGSLFADVEPPVLHKARFRMTSSDCRFGHSDVYFTDGGCGGGYTDVYETDDGQRLRRGLKRYATAGEALAAIEESKRSAADVAERDPPDEQPRRFGQRVVLIGRVDEAGPRTIRILIYDGDRLIFFIDGPSLDLISEFENHSEND